MNGLGSVSRGLRIDGGPDQLRALPLANVTQLRIQFSDPVSVDQSDLSVRGVAVPTYSFAPGGFSYDPASFTGTWTLATPFGNDRVLLDLDAGASGGVATASGIPLDGEWSNGAGAFPSGDGAAGGDFRFRVNVLPGDADGNGSVTVGYVGILSSRFGLSPRGPRQGDFNGDGIITVGDVGILATSFGQSLPAGEPAAPPAATPSAVGSTSRNLSIPRRPAREARLIATETAPGR